ncbi:ATP-binding cassette domain-containing protein [Sphingobacterium thalpophilum]|uniref:ATP-binding cassette domain-containing protein n=2 Tax=Sphingobacterium thalpophilum TaxID=259 RepID=UPI0031D6B4E8
MNTKELYVDSVQFSYDNSRQHITGAYLKCFTGDIVALFGRNGSGKSTLLKIIFGSLKAKNSYILLNGKKVGKTYLTRKVGYLPQDSFLPTQERVSKLVDLLIGDTHHKSLLWNDARIKALQDKKVHQLSGGERRYLEIWLLMCQPTDFVLLDEPFTGIEPIYITMIIDLIRRFSDKKGFIITDHNYHDLLPIASQVVLLQNGSCQRIENKRDLEFFYLPDGTFDE